MNYLRDPLVDLNILLGLILAALALACFRRRQVQKTLGLWLGAYALLAALAAGLQAAALLGWLSSFQARFVSQLPAYAALVLAWLLVALSLEFLRVEYRRWRVWWLILMPIAAILVLDSGVLPLGQVVWQNNQWILTREDLSYGLLLGAWAGMMILASLFTVRTYRITTGPLHRNRLKYWVPILVLCMLADGATLLDFSLPGSVIRLMAVTLALAVTISHDLPDVRRAVRKVLNFSLMAAFSMGIYLVGFVLVDNLLGSDPAYSAFWTGIVMATLVMLLYAPLQRLVQNILGRLMAGSDYDPAAIVGNYSQAISNILDLQRLEFVAIEVIRQAMEISAGALWLIDQSQAPGDEAQYCLRPIANEQSDQAPSFTLAAGSQVVRYFNYAGHPLSQYDLDLHPQFNELSPEEKAHFSHTGMDVYVPIFSKGNWIGLFMLGSKISRDRYYDEDLALLSTLAGQTAVALENARLVDNLVQLNRELEKAYHDLGATNQKLEKLDRAKSDFISVASHELRTPLTLMVGYGQMLVDDPKIQANPYHLEIAEGICDGTNRLHEIVGSMLDMVSIESRSLELDTRPVPISFLVQSILGGLEKTLEERKLRLDTTGLKSGLELEADHAALEKVFNHLIINAIKFTPDGGQISVSAQQMPARTSPLQKDSIEVVITDTGIGVDAQFHELIFTKFYQTGEVLLHSSGKTKFKGGGPGLGLAIVRGIVEAHHGKVWVESCGYDEKNCPGSQFHVVLPVHQSEF